MSLTTDQPSFQGGEGKGRGDQGGGGGKGSMHTHNARGDFVNLGIWPLA